MTDWREATHRTFTGQDPAIALDPYFARGWFAGLIDNAASDKDLADGLRGYVDALATISDRERRARSLDLVPTASFVEADGSETVVAGYPAGGAR